MKRSLVYFAGRADRDLLRRVGSLVPRVSFLFHRVSSAQQNCARLLTHLNQQRLFSDGTRPVSRKKQTATSIFDFAEEAERMLKAIEKAVTPLQTQNPGFEVQHGAEGELVIVTQRGRHTVSVDGGRQLLVLQSYFSGFHKYAFAAEDGTWLSVKDGHDMRGLITRDLMRHCAGVPEFH